MSRRARGGGRSLKVLLDTRVLQNCIGGMPGLDLLKAFCARPGMVADVVTRTVDLGPTLDGAQVTVAHPDRPASSIHAF